MLIPLFLSLYSQALENPIRQKQNSQKLIVTIMDLPGSSANHSFSESGLSRRAVISANNAVKTTLNDICFFPRIY